MNIVKESVLQFISTYYTPKLGKPILIGLSGGADSLCLLHVFKTIFPQLIVAHFNHRLRPEADEEAAYVAELIKGMNIPLVIGSGEVLALAEKEKRGIEEAARILRYRFLFNVARQYHVQAVAVGHHADDQVETVLLHFLRGTGSSGLRGMLPIQWTHPWDSHIPLIRPLLNVWKNDVLDYCRENQLIPIVDQSNADITYLRNRLRHVLLPQLASEYNAQIKQCLLQTAQVIAVEMDFLEKETEKAWKECVLFAGDAEIVLSPESFLKNHLAVQRLLFRRALWALLPEMRDIDYESTQRGVAFINHSITASQKRSRRLHLLKDVYIYYEKALLTKEWDRGDVIVITKKESISVHDRSSRLSASFAKWSQYPKAPIDAQEIKIPCKIELSGWILHCEEQFIAGEKGDYEKIKNNPNPFAAYFDLDVLEAECRALVIRRRKAGDRFQPLGMENGTVKLSDYMINVKIPHRFRDDWLLLCCENKILWVAGYQIAHPYRVTEKTTRVLFVQVYKKE